MNVPWTKVYMDETEVSAVSELIRSSWVSMGSKVREFEETLAQYVGVKHAVALNSGTAALDTSLKVLGIGPGDEVIVPAFTYIATANAVLLQHAIPVFAEISPETLNLDPEDVVRKISAKTRCIIPIDYAGQAAEFDRLRNIADTNGLFLVEDGAPGLGGSYRGKRLCSFGDISITSFHVAKVFTTVEGGMIFTDQEEYAEKARVVRSQGEDPEKKYFHSMLGHNFRMTDINAAIGLVQIGRKDRVLQRRREAAEYYLAQLQGHSAIELLHPREKCEHAWFLFPILLENRDEVRKRLGEKGIGTNVSWPMPVYDQEHLRPFKKAVCPVSETACKSVLCLPMYYQLTRDEQDYVVSNLIKAVDDLAYKATNK